MLLFASNGLIGERGGARAGKPRCVSILTITAGSSMAAMILNSPPHCGQCSRSRSKTRLSRRAQPMRAGASCACSSAGTLVFCAGPSANEPPRCYRHSIRRRARRRRRGRSGGPHRRRGHTQCLASGSGAVDPAPHAFDHQLGNGSAAVRCRGFRYFCILFRMSVPSLFRMS